jgi:hypothetical protein
MQKLLSEVVAMGWLGRRVLALVERPVRGWVETKWPLRKTTTTEMMIVGGTSRREIISSRGQSEKESRPQTLPLCLCVPRLPRGVCHAFGCYFCLLCSVCITFAVQ